MDVDDIDPDGLDGDEEDLDAAIAEDVDDEPEPPPLRSHDYRPGHRQVKPTKVVAPAGPSPWERPRDGFTASMTERVPVMRTTKQASFVKGTSRDA